MTKLPLSSRPRIYILHISKVAICTRVEQATAGSLLSEIVFSEQREGVRSETRGWWKEGKVKRTVFIVFRVAGSIDRRTFCFTPFRFDTAQSEKHHPPPSSSSPSLAFTAATPPATPFAVYFILIWNTAAAKVVDRRSPSLFLPGSLQPFATSKPPFARLSSSNLLDPGGWLLPFFSFRLRPLGGRRRKILRKKRKNGGDDLVGGDAFTSSLFLSLSLSLPFSLTCKQVSMQCSALELITIKSNRRYLFVKNITIGHTFSGADVNRNK